MATTTTTAVEAPAIPSDSPFAVTNAAPKKAPAVAANPEPDEGFSFSFDLKAVKPTAGTLVPVVPVIADAEACVGNDTRVSPLDHRKMFARGRRGMRTKTGELDADEYADEEDEHHDPAPSESKPVFDVSTFDVSGFAAVLPAVDDQASSATELGPCSATGSKSS